MKTVKKDNIVITQDDSNNVTIYVNDAIIKTLPYEKSISDEDLGALLDGIWKIFNVDYDNITLAFIYAHYTYRDTGIIEDSHSENKTLDITF